MSSSTSATSARNAGQRGTPQKYGTGGYAKNEEDESRLGPMHNGYHDIDACPTLTLLREGAEDPELSQFLHLAVDHRPAEELFDIRSDPDCLHNLADSSDHARGESEVVEAS